MTDNRKSGIALIAGSLGAMFTMAIHPHGAGGLTPAQANHLALASAIAHSIAIVSNAALVLGACGLARRLNAQDRLAFSGLVTYLFAAVAILIAAAVSGFIVPAIIQHMLRDSVTAAPQWEIAITSMFQINQAFARIYTVAGSAAMVLWSAAALRNGGLGGKLAVYGCIIGPLLILGIYAGHLTLDVHGMTVVVLLQAIWFIGAGIQLMRSESGVTNTPIPAF